MRNVRGLSLVLIVIALSSCSSLEVAKEGGDAASDAQLYRWTRDLDLLHAEEPSEMVRGAEAEAGLRYGIAPESALLFVEENIQSSDRRQKAIAVALLKVNSPKLNDRSYLQISPRAANLEAAALEVDLDKPEMFLPLIAAFLQRKGLKGRLSDYYEMNQAEAGAGVAFRLSASGRLETVSYDKYLAMPWVEERDISEDLGYARRPARQRKGQ